MDLDFIEEPKGPFASFILDVCMMGGVTDYEKAEMPIIAEFFSAQSTDAD